MILIIDNYDSFTFNLYQYVGTLNSDVKVYRNDVLSVKEIASLTRSALFFRRGRVTLKMRRLRRTFKRASWPLPDTRRMLGHQAIGEVFGGRVVPAPELVHGKQSL